MSKFLHIKHLNGFPIVINIDYIVKVLPKVVIDSPTGYMPISSSDEDFAKKFYGDVAVIFVVENGKLEQIPVDASFTTVVNAILESCEQTKKET